MNLAALFLTALVAQSGASSEEEARAIAAAVNRHVLSGQSVTLTGERYAELESAEEELSALRSRGDTALIERVEPCRALEQASVQLLSAKATIDAHQDRNHLPAEEWRSAIRANRQAASAIHGALAHFCR